MSFSDKQTIYFIIGSIFTIISFFIHRNKCKKLEKENLKFSSKSIFLWYFAITIFPLFFFPYFLYKVNTFYYENFTSVDPDYREKSKTKNLKKIIRLNSIFSFFGFYAFISGSFKMIDTFYNSAELLKNNSNATMFTILSKPVQFMVFGIALIIIQTIMSSLIELIYDTKEVV